MPVSPDEAATSPTVFGETAAVLLLAPAVGPHEDPACRQFLAGGPRTDGGNLLLVTLTQSPRHRLDALRDHLYEHPPTALTVVAAGPTPDHALERPDWLSDDVTYTTRTVADHGDLTSLGTRITRTLSDWDDTDRAAVCFHSLTTLLLYAELRAVHRFLQVINGQLAMQGARTHYHMDPGAHDEETLAVLRTLFDGVAEVDEEGEWSVLAM